MFCLEQIDWNRFRVVSVEQLLALPSERLDPATSDLPVTLCQPPVLADLLSEELIEKLGVLRCHLNTAPLRLDLSFHDLYRDGGLSAGSSLLLASDADEVLVAPTVAIGCLRNDQAAAAAATPDRTLEVVMVDALLLAGDVMGLKNILDALE